LAACFHTKMATLVCKRAQAARITWVCAQGNLRIPGDSGLEVPRTCERNSTYLKALLVKIPRYLPASALGVWSSECILRMCARDLPGACVYTGTLGWVVGAQVFPLGDSNRDANHTSVLGVLERWVRVNSPARLV
jgi:hypothetical protein